MTAHYQKISVSVVALALVILAFLGQVDGIGKRYTDESFSRALVTFGVARGLNAVISVAQGTEVAMEPAGVGVIFAPGQVLEPVNDLIERFSWIMLASTTSLGIQSLLLKMFSSGGFSLLIGLVVCAALVMMWWPHPLPDMLRKGVYRLTYLLLIVRFLVPVMAIANEGFYTFFLEPEYAVSSAHLAETRETIGSLNEVRARQVDHATTERNWYDSLRDNVTSMLDSMNIDKQMASLQTAVATLTEHTINLIVVFTLQTIFFPLFFLWLTAKFFKALIR